MARDRSQDSKILTFHDFCSRGESNELISENSSPPQAERKRARDSKSNLKGHQIDSITRFVNPPPVAE